MKEALVSKDIEATIVDSPIPEPKDGQLLIQVVVSGSNPKDWKYPLFRGQTFNPGDDIAGIVTKIGPNVTGFKVGDRVAAFHEIGAPHGSFAEYAIAWDHTTFHIPDSTTFEEASTIPLAALTAVVGLYSDQGLPQPWLPATEPIPLIVYGGATSVGTFAIQLAKHSNIHPIIAVAGSSSAYVEKFLDRSKGDTIVDYRKGDVGELLRQAVGDLKVFHAFDAVAEHDSNLYISKALQPTGLINGVLPWKEHADIPATTKHVTSSVANVHKNLHDLGFVFSRYFTRSLQQGCLKPHAHEVQPGGLGGLQDALRRLKDGKAHAVKYVFRIADTA